MPIYLPHDHHVSAGAHKSRRRQDCATPTRVGATHSSVKSADDGDTQSLTRSRPIPYHTQGVPFGRSQTAATPEDECEPSTLSCDLTSVNFYYGLSCCEASIVPPQSRTPTHFSTFSCYQVTTNRSRESFSGLQESGDMTSHELSAQHLHLG